MKLVFAIVFTLAFYACNLFEITPAIAQTAAASVTGTVADSSGTPIDGAAVALRGATTYSATTDASGKFTIDAVTPGLYALSVTKAGYETAIQSSLAVVPGQQQTVAIVLSQKTLTSLRTIATVQTVGRGTFNTTPASIDVIPASVFADQGQPQVFRVLNQIPGVQISFPATSANGAAPGSVSVPTIRGASSYETASLIDGHPLATAGFGDYITSYLSSYMFGNTEIVKGPGASALEVNNAVNGTINFRTLDPTATVTPAYTFGFTSHGGTYSNFGISDTIGRWGFVLDVATANEPSALSGKSVLIDPSFGFLGSPNGTQLFGNATFSTLAPTQSNIQTGYSLLACCYTFTSNYDNTSELAKLRYHFSGATTATVTYLGGQTITDQNGNTGNFTNAQFTPGDPAYSGALAPGGQQVAFLFPGANNTLRNNEPIFEAELSTTLNNDTILARWYHASIFRQTLQGTSPTTLDPYILTLYGVSGGAPTFSGVTAPIYFADYFDEVEQDKLGGWSLQYDHPFGLDDVSLAVDQTNTQSTNYETTSSFTSVFIPTGSSQLFTTAQLRAHLVFGAKLQATIADYQNNYRSTYATSCPFAFGFSNCAIDGSNVGFATTTASHNDPRLGLVYQPSSNLAVRFSMGSSIAPPFLNLLSTVTSPVATWTPAAGTAVLTKNSGQLLPETAFGFDLGADYRFKGDTVVSGDVYQTNLFNHYFGESLNANITCGQATSFTCEDSNGNTAPANTPVFYAVNTNISNFRFQGIELSVRHAPAVGFGYVLAGSLQRGYVYNLPPFFYCSNPGPGCTSNQNFNIIANQNLNGEGIGGNFSSSIGSLNNRIPYAQGNLEVSYRLRNGAYAAIGDTLYGNNNSLNEPSFGIAYASVRYPVTSTLAIQISGDNIFNAWPGFYPIFGGGLSIPLANGGLAATTGNVLGPATWRFEVTKALGAPLNP